MSATRGAWRGLFAAVLLASVAAAAAAAPWRAAQAGGGDASPSSAGQVPVRFETLDVLLDSHGATLVAWQARFVDPTGRARIVGVEGGDDPAFAAPPFHDPRALSQGELVLAAFDTSHTGPTTRSRVARLHLAVTGDAPAHFDVALEVAAGPSGPIAGATCVLSP